jgi:hypothetical protein
MLRIPHCLENRLTDGGKVVSPTHRPRSTRQKHYFSGSDTHFCYRLSKTLVRPEGLGKLKEFIHLIEPRTRNLPVCSIIITILYLAYCCFQHETSCAIMEVKVVTLLVSCFPNSLKAMRSILTNPVSIHGLEPVCSSICSFY